MAEKTVQVTILVQFCANMGRIAHNLGADQAWLTERQNINVLILWFFFFVSLPNVLRKPGGTSLAWYLFLCGHTD